MDLLEALFLLEGLTVEQTIDKFVPQGISEEEIIDVIKHDPTSKYDAGKAGDYSQWVLEKMKHGEKPTPKFYVNLEVFDKARKKKNFTGEKDIFLYKSIEEFDSFMSENDIENKSEVELRTGIKPIFVGKNYTLYHPKTHEESKILRGDEAVWCTGRHDTDSFWKEYNDRGDIIIFYNNTTNKPEYQLFISSYDGGETLDFKEFRDTDNGNDKEIEDFLRENLDINTFINSKFKASPKAPLIGLKDEYTYIDFTGVPDGKKRLLFGVIPVRHSNFNIARWNDMADLPGDIDEEDLNEYDIISLAEYISRNDFFENFKLADDFTYIPGDYVNSDEEYVMFKISKDGKLYEAIYEDYGEHIFLKEVRMTSLQKNNINGVTLLSTEEANKVPVEIRKFPCWWWLRSQGHDDINVAYVYRGGTVDARGESVDLKNCAVRPALLCSNLRSLNLEIGSVIETLGKTWQYIGNDMILLSGSPLTRMAFRKDLLAPDANVYEKSDVKKYLDNWLKELMSKES